MRKCTLRDVKYVAAAVGLYVQASRVGLRVVAIYVTRVQSDSLSQSAATLESDN